MSTAIWQPDELVLLSESLHALPSAQLRGQSAIHMLVAGASCIPCIFTGIHVRMRFLFPFVALFCLPASAQHFRDLSFEHHAVGTPPSSWAWSFSDGLAPAITSELAMEGRKALHLQGAFTPYGAGYVVQGDTGRYPALQALRISAKVRVLKGARGVELFAYTTSADGNTLNYQMRQAEESATGDWQELTLTCWVDRKVSILRIGLQFKSEVDLLVDGFKVEAMPRSDAPVAPELAQYAEEFFALIEEHSLYRSSLDMPALRDDLQQLLAGGTTVADLQTVANFFLKSVDKHSFYWSKAEVDAWRGADTDDEEDPNGEEAFDFPITTGHLIGEDVAYLNMPQFNSGNEAWDTYFADTLQGLIRTLDRPGLKGWVLDLRVNHGGNCWPMLAGIGPVLGNGVCGYFGLDDDRFYWSYMDGGSLTDDTVQCSVSRSPYVLLAADPRVAVITGPGTASSGEVVAVAFRGRPGARSFGTPTAGYSTTNTNFDLSDGAMLFLATSVYVDRAKNPYGDAIPPDELIPTSAEGDAPLERAVQWLRSQ